jgi:hypothetical protein
MNTHLDDGSLRAFLDEEPGGSTALEEAARHIAGCPACQERLEEIAAKSRLTGQHLAFLASPPETSSLQARSAYTQFKHRLNQTKEKPMLQKIFRLRTLFAGLAVTALLVIALSIPSGFAWAGQFLGLFRVQQVAVVPIDPTGLVTLRGNSVIGQQISQLLAQSINFDQKPGKAVPVSTAEQASQAAGFTVRLPESELVHPALLMQPGAAFSFTVDRVRAQALLDEAGRTDLVLPQSLDKETISVTIPNSVTASYGDCPSQVEEMAGLGSNGRRYADCMVLAEMPSPTVHTPPDVDVQKLAEIGLQFTGMTADEALAYTQSIDWTSSLVIPLPKNAATYQKISVDGVNGMLIQRPADDAPEFALVWVKDGIIYTIGGLGSDSPRAIAMANSLK